MLAGCRRECLNLQPLLLPASRAATGVNTPQQLTKYHLVCRSSSSSIHSPCHSMATSGRTTRAPQPDLCRILSARSSAVSASRPRAAARGAGEGHAKQQLVSRLWLAAEWRNRLGTLLPCQALTRTPQLLRAAAALEVAATPVLHALLDGQGTPLLDRRLPADVGWVLPPAAWVGAGMGSSATLGQAWLARAVHLLQDVFS